jgi:hypothetical protein
VKRAFCKGSDQLLGWHLLGWLFAFLWLGGCVVHNVLSGGLVKLKRRFVGTVTWLPSSSYCRRILPPREYNGASFWRVDTIDKKQQPNPVKT